MRPHRIVQTIRSSSPPCPSSRRDITLPSGFGYDFAGRVDEVGDGEGLSDEVASTLPVTALALGVAPDRIVAIAAGPNPPGGVRAVVGGDAQPDAIPQVAAAIVAKKVTVPIAAKIPDRADQRDRGAASQPTRPRKIVVTL